MSLSQLRWARFFWIGECDNAVEKIRQIITWALIIKAVEVIIIISFVVFISA